MGPCVRRDDSLKRPRKTEKFHAWAAQKIPYAIALPQAGRGPGTPRQARPRGDVPSPGALRRPLPARGARLENKKAGIAPGLRCDDGVRLSSKRASAARPATT